MRTIFFYTISFLLLFNYSYAQEKPARLAAGEIYKVSINAKDKGFLANLTDSSMQVSNIKCKFRGGVANKVYNYYDVDQFSIHRNGNNLRRVLWGAGIGMVAGVLSSLGVTEIGGDNRENPVNLQGISVGTGAVVGLVGGAVAGLFATTIKHRFSIGKQKAAFQSAYADLSYQ